MKGILAFVVVLQLAVTLQPGESIDVSCAGQIGTIAATSTLVTVPCVAPPPPPPPGTVVQSDAIDLPANGNGVIIHQSAGLTIGGPAGSPRLTADGVFQVDDRAGGPFQGAECVLDHLDVYVGGDYRGSTNGLALIRVYPSTVAQVTNGTQTPSPGWVAISDAQELTSIDAVQWRSFTFSGAQRVVTMPSMWFAVDWHPVTNDYYNTLVVRFNLYDGVRPFINDGFTLRTTTGQGVPLATPAFRVFEAC